MLYILLWCERLWANLDEECAPVKEKHMNVILKEVKKSLKDVDDNKGVASVLNVLSNKLLLPDDNKSIKGNILDSKLTIVHCEKHNILAVSAHLKSGADAKNNPEAELQPVR